MKKPLVALSVLALLPSIAAAQWYGTSFGTTIVDTGNRNIAVHAFHSTSPLVVGIQNNSSDYIRCSTTFSNIPVIHETHSTTIAPGKSAALVNREGYPTARIDVQVKCSEKMQG